MHKIILCDFHNYLINCLRDLVLKSEFEWNCLYRNWNYIAKTELTTALNYYNKILAEMSGKGSRIDGHKGLTWGDPYGFFGGCTPPPPLPPSCALFKVKEWVICVQLES